jgi:integrase
VPLVYPLTRPAIGYSGFYHALNLATDRAMNVHDLRKTAESWWEEAGIPDWRIEYYVGHVVRKDLRAIYRKPREMARLLHEDAERVRTWLGDPPQPSIRAVNA